MKKIAKNGIYFLLGFLVALALFSAINSNQERLLKLNGELLEGHSNVVAVTGDGRGVLGKVVVEIKKGDGKVLVNTNPFLEPDTQLSANIAVNVAEKFTQKSLKDRDVIFDFEVESQVVGGPSAGAAMALALISALENQSIRSDIVVTGTILPDGSIGQIGGVAEKADGASRLGIKTFFVPLSQSTFKYYEKAITKRNIGNGLTLYNTTYIPKKIDLKEYYENQRMDIIEVKNISELWEIIS
jgi:uncharacterized protein